MGAVGGGLWHLLKGMKNSPSGHRFVGGIDVGAPASGHCNTCACLPHLAAVICLFPAPALCLPPLVLVSASPPAATTKPALLTLPACAVRMCARLQAIRREAPRIGGSFAVWGGLFSTFDCTLVALRKKEDPWNSIAAGALTGGWCAHCAVLCRVAVCCIVEASLVAAAEPGQECWVTAACECKK
jgi:hypothetical protein